MTEHETSIALAFKRALEQIASPENDAFQFEDSDTERLDELIYFLQLESVSHQGVGLVAWKDWHRLGLHFWTIEIGYMRYRTFGPLVAVKMTSLRRLESKMRDRGEAFRIASAEPTEVEGVFVIQLQGDASYSVPVTRTQLADQKRREYEWRSRYQRNRRNQQRG